jgi:hypothetical protein
MAQWNLIGYHGRVRYLSVETSGSSPEHLVSLPRTSEYLFAARSKWG